MNNQTFAFEAVDDEVLGAASGGTNLSYTSKITDLSAEQGYKLQNLVELQNLEVR